jgi:predicted Zn-dependent protease
MTRSFTTLAFALALFVGLACSGGELGVALPNSLPTAAPPAGQQMLQGYSSRGLIVANSPYLPVARRIASRVRNVAQPLKERYYIVKDKQLNAYAAQGGYVFINDATLRDVENEAEFACVIGHETAHLKLGHEDKKTAAQIATNVLAKIGGFFARKSKAAQFAITAGGYAAKFGFADFTKAQEYAADQKGVELAAAAGYNPWGEVWFLRVAKRLNGDTGFEPLVADHPSIDDRTKRLEAFIKSNPKLAKWPSQKPRHSHGLEANE